MQPLQHLQAERDAIAAELAAIRSEIAGLGASSEYMIDEETWDKLQAFVEAIQRMRSLQKGANTPKDLANLRELERLVDAAVVNFSKSI